MTATATASAASPAVLGRPRRGLSWPIGLGLLTVGAAVLTTWGIQAGSRSDYYAAIAVSMSQSWSNFFFGSLDPAGTVTLDKIPGSFWVPALFVRLFGFSDWAVILPNALAAVAAVVLVAVTAKRLAGPTAGLIAGTVVATTPILIAVSRSNQPETFFMLGLALTAWAASKALTRASFGWLMAAGLFIALSFQMYMIEAWAVWPALAAAWLSTRQRWARKLWRLAIAGVVSLAASLPWIVVVSLIPAADRPYIGSTLHNSPWEMVFGYNALGRFGQSTTDADAYRSFTPPFSGSAGLFRLANEQLAGQIAWLIPAAVLAIAVLWALRFSRAVTVFLGVWLVTFLVMFSAVAGMHQFYTASLALPIGLLVGLAFGAAVHRRAVWAQVSLLAAAAVAALGVASIYGGYSIAVAVVQALLAAAAVVVILLRARRGSRATPWLAVLATAALVLTPAAWSVVTLAHPSSTNPVAGGISDTGGFGGGFGGGARPGASGLTGAPGAQAGGPGGGFGQDGSPTGSVTRGRTGGQGGGFGGGTSSDTLAWLEAHRGDATYLVATFGAQSAAALIIDSGGASVLPIGGFNGTDPVPTLAAFQQLIADGDLRYVLASGGGGGGMGTSGSTSSSSEIRSWVEDSCTAVADAAASGLYDCAGV